MYGLAVNLIMSVSGHSSIINEIPLLKINGVLWVSLNIASTSGCISAKDCKIPNFVGDSTLDNFPSVVENDSKTFSIGNPRGQHGD